MYDIAIIGGGINGCGIARDAAGRGYRVALFEQNDLASSTSSASTKLIHGGLRYLEHYEFRLVRESLMEREVIWSIAPHIVWPLRFVLPHHQGLRPAWLLRLGLFLYDHIGGRRRLKPTRSIDLRYDPVGASLKAGYRRAFEYSDCWVEDARLVVLNALDAFERGASINPRTKVVSARREGDCWQLRVQDRRTGLDELISARILINAAGPWAAEVAGATISANDAGVRLVQGSHIVVPRLFEHDRAYIFQNADNRIIFAIPYEGEFTLIGTTDRDYQGDAATVETPKEDIEYLCTAASEYFARAIEPSDVVWTFSGVRPLYDDGASAAQEATRDYVLKTDGGEGRAASLSIYGGKITTYRRLAEHVLRELKPFLPASDSSARGEGWTGREPLPGGDFPIDGTDSLVARLAGEHAWLPAKLARRFIRAYGTRAWHLLHGCCSLADLGSSYGAGLTQREIDYLRENEWAISAEDVLWRRSKLGLHMRKSERDAVRAAMGG